MAYFGSILSSAFPKWTKPLVVMFSVTGSNATLTQVVPLWYCGRLVAGFMRAACPRLRQTATKKISRERLSATLSSKTPRGESGARECKFAVLSILIFAFIQSTSTLTSVLNCITKSYGNCCCRKPRHGSIISLEIRPLIT